jgi:hypothetical protein
MKTIIIKINKIKTGWKFPVIENRNPVITVLNERETQRTLQRLGNSTVKHPTAGAVSE